MICSDHNHELICRHSGEVKKRVLYLSFDKTKLSHPVVYCFGNLRGISYGQLYF